MGEASKLSVQGLWWDSLGRRDACNGIRVTQVFFFIFSEEIIVPTPMLTGPPVAQR